MGMLGTGGGVKTPIGPLGGVGINLDSFICILRSVAAFLTDKDLLDSLSYYSKVTHN